MLQHLGILRHKQHQSSLLSRPKNQLKQPRWSTSLSSPLKLQNIPGSKKLAFVFALPHKSGALSTNAIFQRPLQLRLSNQVSVESYHHHGHRFLTPDPPLPRKNVHKSIIWCGKQVSRDSKCGLKNPQYQAAFHTHKFSPSSPSGPAWVHLQNPCRCKG